MPLLLVGLWFETALILIHIKNTLLFISILPFAVSYIFFGSKLQLLTGCGSPFLHHKWSAIDGRWCVLPVAQFVAREPRHRPQGVIWHLNATKNGPISDDFCGPNWHLLQPPPTIRLSHDPKVGNIDHQFPPISTGFVGFALPVLPGVAHWDARFQLSFLLLLWQLFVRRNGRARNDGVGRPSAGAKGKGQPWQSQKLLFFFKIPKVIFFLQDPASNDPICLESPMSKVFPANWLADDGVSWTRSEKSRVFSKLAHKRSRNGFFGLGKSCEITNCWSSPGNRCRTSHDLKITFCWKDGDCHQKRNIQS